MWIGPAPIARMGLLTCHTVLRLLLLGHYPRLSGALVRLCISVSYRHSATSRCIVLRRVFYGKRKTGWLPVREAESNGQFAHVLALRLAILATRLARLGSLTAATV